MLEKCVKLVINKNYTKMHGQWIIKVSHFIWDWLSSSQFVFSTSFPTFEGTDHLTVVHCGKADYIVNRLILRDWQAFCCCAICSLLLEHICRLRQENAIRRVNRLQAGQFGVWIPVGARDFLLLQNVQNGFGTHPSSYSVGTGILSWRYNGQYMKLIIHFCLVLSLKMSVAIPLFAL
jgi:hypothetical protein